MKCLNDKAECKLEECNMLLHIDDKRIKQNKVGIGAQTQVYKPVHGIESAVKGRCGYGD